MTLETMMQREVMLSNIEGQLEELTARTYGKSIADCTDAEVYACVMQLIKEMIKATPQISGDKKVYYISAEFLIGKLLSNNLINLRLYEKVEEILKKNGKALADVEEAEAEPSLGNGGLGRLAACFMDSIATLGLPGAGIGLNYHFGLFRQVFEELQQKTVKDEWIDDQCWLNKTDVSYNISLAGKNYKSVMYDIDVVGYNNGINKLHLFDLESVDDSIVKEGISFDQRDIEKNLTLFLYPDDSTEDGRLLRIYQQYFMVSNAAHLIIDELEAQMLDLHSMYNHAVIQINDTHPTMIIPELIRILTEEKRFKMDEAIRVVSQTCAYTNHTILAEALEKWPLDYLERVVPQLIPIIRELDRRVVRKYTNDRVWVIDRQDLVHMAHIDIHYGFSVNGVAAIHTEILKETALRDFYEIYPEKFNNKTNGITFRRWLLACNRELSAFITKTIGELYKKDATQLEKLLDHVDDKGLLDELAGVKMVHKRKLAAYIEHKEGVKIDPDSVYDIQIKRLHEYKRQQLNALYIIHRYLEIKAGKVPETKVTFIFGAKASPAYIEAQDIIHLILVLQELINSDPVASKYMKVVMVENYNVSYAEKLIPACDISEQISLASQEASGTGNMKFMLNGAVTLGTEDGANVEIHELVGDDNIYIFGVRAPKVQAFHQGREEYSGRDYYEKSPVIKEAVDFILSEEVLSIGIQERLQRLYDRILGRDWFMTLIDMEDYIKVKDKALKDYNDREKWKKMALVNIAKAGFFSSDRTIKEYNNDIWKMQIETDKDRD